MMKVTGDTERYVSLHMDTISKALLPYGGYLRFGNLPEPPHYALEIVRDNTRTTYRGPVGQILDKYQAELKRK